MSTSTSPTIAPYGTWESPISVETISGKTLSIQECAVSAVVCYTAPDFTTPIEVIPKDFSCRTSIHEYGGAAFKPYPNEEAFVFTVPDGNRGVFKVNLKAGVDGNTTVSEPITLIPGSKTSRYGNFAINPTDSKWILAVLEDHRGDKPDDVVNSLVSIHGESGDVKTATIVEGKDFYSSPSWNPDGSRVAWLQWSHPDMPWTGSEVCVADWIDGKLESVRVVAGKANTESTSQPRWSPDGSLFYCSDRTEITSSTPVSIPEDLVSNAEHIVFPRVSSPETTTESYAWYYAPQNPAYKAPNGALPPLVISLHGGPTAHSTCGLSLSIQYWTSRGYAYAFVNYTGSTGYGRKFRDALNTKWGIADVSDAADCVSYLVSQNLIDKTRVGIVGGSAGGYGVLQAICSYPDVWAACVSNYGISSLKALVDDTHKFESRYMDNLLWDLDAPQEARDHVLKERSPLLRAGNIKTPVLLLQGVDDRVVPKEQAEEMAKVIKDNGGVVEVELFEGEGHGWRKQETVVKAINLQENWWKKYLVRA
ncbi:Seprase [Dactylellina cionopaga]|nr:Seprase [Dactylellina cionopaga]